ncbi:hypothetical protein MKOR_07610 [Mycolicibacillus koreensis]|nr:hypothetical protein MKOR_07610 [Mycolicibacillus koreensis]
MEAVAAEMICADVGPPSSIVAAWITYRAGSAAGGGGDGLAESDRGLVAGLAHQVRTGRARDRRGHPAAVAQLGIGRVGDRVDRQRGDVDLGHLQVHARRTHPHSAAHPNPATRRTVLR